MHVFVTQRTENTIFNFNIKFAGVNLKIVYLIEHNYSKYIYFEKFTDIDCQEIVNQICVYLA